MNDKTYQMTMLFDFFGDLLTEKQREYFDLYYNQDLSLSEIAENVGITRQGVYDIILRAENTLIEIEDKTGVIRRFAEMRADIDEALRYVDEIGQISPDGRAAELVSKLNILFENMKG